MYNVDKLDNKKKKFKNINIKARYLNLYRVEFNKVEFYLGKYEKYSN